MNYVCGIENGKVIFGTSKVKGRWWLPIAHVLEHGMVIEHAPHNARIPAAARKKGQWSPRVMEIIELLRKGGMWQKDIAARYGITPAAVSQINVRAQKAGLLPR